MSGPHLAICEIENPAPPSTECPTWSLWNLAYLLYAPIKINIIEDKMSFGVVPMDDCITVVSDDLTMSPIPDALSCVSVDDDLSVAIVPDDLTMAADNDC